MGFIDQETINVATLFFLAGVAGGLLLLFFARKSYMRLCDGLVEGVGELIPEDLRLSGMNRP